MTDWRTRQQVLAELDEMGIGFAITPTARLGIRALRAERPWAKGANRTLWHRPGWVARVRAWLGRTKKEDRHG